MTLYAPSLPPGNCWVSPFVMRIDSLFSRVGRLRIALIWAMAWIVGGLPVTARSEYVEPSLWIGWQGHVVLGRWIPAVWDVNADVIGDGGIFRLDVVATDPDGNLAVFTGDETSLDANHRRLHGRFQLGRPDGQIRFRVYRENALKYEHVPISAGMSDFFLQTHPQSERLLITIGLPDGVQQLFEPSAPGKRTVLHFADAKDLPTDDWAYDSVAELFLAGATVPNETQAAAISQWVQRGGRLSLSIGMPPSEFRETPLVKSLPIEVAPEPNSTRELTSLETYAGKTVRIIPPGTRLPVPKVSFPFGKVWAGNRTDSLLVEVSHGFGTAMVLTLDVTQAPLKNWPGLRDLLRKMTGSADYAAAAGNRSQQLGTTGITELASQVLACLEHFPSVSRLSPWWVLGGLIVVTALIGPLDYWLTGRVFRRPFATWITLPIILAASVVAAAWTAERTNGPRWLANQLDVVDIDAEKGYVRGWHFVTIYSPESNAAEITVQPTWTKSGARNDRMQIGWEGLPESSFGGMYGSEGGRLRFGQAEYEIASQAGTIHGLPLAQWSTTSLSALSEADRPDLVESHLSSTATGRLSGTIQHHLPAALTDWFLVYAGRIHRLPVKSGSEEVVPLAPKQLFRIEQKSVVQRELRGYLTQTTARELQESKDRNQIVVQQTAYNPLSRDLKRLLPVLTFHGDIGGSTYTNLSNESLAELDLSELLALDRAVLIGYLERPAAELKFAEGVTPGVQVTTFVRLVLPVDSKQQTFRELKKFDKP